MDNHDYQSDHYSSRPSSFIREYWSSILPRVPDDDRREQWHTLISEQSEDVRNSLVGNCIAWGSHVVHLGTQSNSASLRYIYWGRIVSYRHKVKKHYPEIVPGLFVDEYAFVMPLAQSTHFPSLYTSPSAYPTLKTTKK